MKNSNAECCTCCGRVLRSKSVVLLELSVTDGNFYKIIPEGQLSQGHFCFGKSCAKTILKRQKRIQNRDSQ